MDTIKNETDNEISFSPATTDLDIKIKVIVTLYVGICWIYCVALLCESMIHVTLPNASKICFYAPYSFYTALLTESLFYFFYVIRMHVILKNSVFELSKTTQLVMGIAPIVMLPGSFLSYLVYTQSHDCKLDKTAFSLLGMTIVIHSFWNVTLFFFFIFQLRRTTNGNMVSQSIQKILKNYVKRLFRLFLLSEAFAFVGYGVFIIPHLFQLNGPVVAIDISVNCTVVLLSFQFGKSVFSCCKIWPLKKKAFYFFTYLYIYIFFFSNAFICICYLFIFFLC